MLVERARHKNWMSSFSHQTLYMKRVKLIQSKMAMLLAFVLVSIAGFAQNGGGADINVDINKGGGSNWYAQPWVWIVGAAVFILLLVALLRGSGSRNND